MRPKAVLFDCDGVLVDSEPTSFRLLDAEMTAHGHPMTPEELDHHFLGGTIGGVADSARAMGVPLAPDWVETFYAKLYDELAKGTDLMPGVARVLEGLERAGIAYAVGSNGSRTKMETTLGQHPAVWARLKDRLFSGQEVDAPKPAPDLYLTAARALRVAPQDCVVIEDSAPGARAGIAAGMRVLGFAPRGGADKLTPLGIEVIDSFDTLITRWSL